MLLHRLFVMAGPDNQSAKGVTTTGGRPLRPYLTHLISSNLFTHLIFLPGWHPRPVQRHLPPDLVPPSCPPWASPSNLSSASSSSVTIFLHPKKKRPLLLSVSLLHLFILLIQMGIEPHTGPVQDSCSVCGDRVHSGWVSFLCMVWDQCCHNRCSEFHSPAD